MEVRHPTSSQSAPAESYGRCKRENVTTILPLFVIGDHVKLGDNGTFMLGSRPAPTGAVV